MCSYCPFSLSSVRCASRSLVRSFSITSTPDKAVLAQCQQREQKARSNADHVRGNRELKGDSQPIQELVVVLLQVKKAEAVVHGQYP